MGGQFLPSFTVVRKAPLPIIFRGHSQVCVHNRLAPRCRVPIATRSCTRRRSAESRWRRVRATQNPHRAIRPCRKGLNRTTSGHSPRPTDRGRRRDGRPLLRRRRVVLILTLLYSFWPFSSVSGGPRRIEKSRFTSERHRRATDRTWTKYPTQMMKMMKGGGSGMKKMMRQMEAMKGKGGYPGM